MARLTVVGGVLILALLAAGFTEATLALGPHSSLTNDTALRPASSTPTPTFMPSPTLAPTAVPTATPAPTSTVPTATTTAFIHVRSGKSTTAPIVTDLNAGTVVELLSDSDTQWQQIRYGSITGYVFKSTAFAN